jgi:hypothetical protein
MIAGWLDLVEAMDAGTVIAALPAPVQDLFSHLDPGSTVCVKKIRKKLRLLMINVFYFLREGR